MTTIAIIYHSGYGHTKVLAEAVQAGARSVAGVAASLVPVDEAEQRWDELDAVDAIVFGSPTYMGSVSTPFKAFMDASSKVWMRRGWADKLAAGFTNSMSMSGDKLNTLQQFAIFAAQHGMIWVSLNLPAGWSSSDGSFEDLNRIGSSLGAMAQSNSDESAEVVPPRSDRLTAEALGRRVAFAATRWRAGGEHDRSESAPETQRMSERSYKHRKVA